MTTVTRPAFRLLKFPAPVKAQPASATPHIIAESETALEVFEALAKHRPGSIQTFERLANRLLGRPLRSW
jgi:hypothetical protein